MCLTTILTTVDWISSDPAPGVGAGEGEDSALGESMTGAGATAGVGAVASTAVGLDVTSPPCILTM